MSKANAGANPTAAGIDGLGAFYPAAPPARRCRFDTAGFAEPTLQELLGDPFVLSLMRSDGIEPSEVEALFAAIRGRET